jgi:hypothetical protein
LAETHSKNILNASAILSLYTLNRLLSRCLECLLLSLFSEQVQRAGGGFYSLADTPEADATVEAFIDE